MATMTNQGHVEPLPHSPHLQVAELPGKGRSFVFTKAIPHPGTVLLFSPAHGNGLVMDASGRGRVCSTCTKSLIDVAVPCPCGLTHYCCTSCQQHDWIEWHQFECPYFKSHPPSIIVQGLADPEYTTDYTLLLIRVLIHHAKQSCPGAVVKNSKAGEASNPDLFGASTSFQDVWRLCDNMDSFSPAKRAEFDRIVAYLARFLTDTLLSPASPFSTLSIAKFIDGYAKDLDQFLLLLVCKEECNSFGLYSFYLQGPRVPKQSFALALLPSAVFFNHSCAPNVGHVTRRLADGRTGNVFYSLAPCVEGEEATISYLPAKPLLPTSERQKTLEDVFHFRCECSLCTGAVHTRADVCKDTTCFGWYVPSTVGRPNCVLPQNHDDGVSLVDGSFSLSEAFVENGDVPAGKYTEYRDLVCEACGSAKPELQLSA